MRSAVGCSAVVHEIARRGCANFSRCRCCCSRDGGLDHADGRTVVSRSARSWPCMMLGETEYRHQVESDMLPFRDILLGLFFITVGMQLDTGMLSTHWHWIPPRSPGVRVQERAHRCSGGCSNWNSGVALRTGLVLVPGRRVRFRVVLQAGEFNLLDAQASQFVLATVVLSMMLAPLVVRHNAALAKRLAPGYLRARDTNLDVIRAEAASAIHQMTGRTSEASRATVSSRGPRLRPGGERVVNRHVIICGYGRSGQNLAWLLEQENVPSLALDLDPVRVRDARDAGKPVAYGDAARRDVLEAAGLHRATVLVISFNDISSALRILEVTRHVRPDMPVIVRTMDDAELERLKAAGATEVVPESLEGTLMMGSHLLMLFGVPVSRIVRHVRDVRRDRYRRCAASSTAKICSWRKKWRRTLDCRNGCTRSMLPPKASGRGHAAGGPAPRGNRRNVSAVAAAASAGRSWGPEIAPRRRRRGGALTCDAREVEEAEKY